MHKNYWQMTPDDFPEGEPALKQKGGLWYRPNNNGYTDRVTEAGLYTREEVIKDCFHEEEGKVTNGYCNVLGVPVRYDLSGYTTTNLISKIENIKKLMPYAEVSEKDKMVVF
jgi:hypothetical protein